MAEQTITTSNDKAFFSKILWTFAVVLVTSGALTLQQLVPSIQEYTPDWLDEFVAIFVPTLVAILLKFANDNKKNAVEEALYTEIPTLLKK